MAEYKGCNIGPSDRKGKKYKAQCGDNPPVHFGASGYRIKPGTPAGDNYCARSQGIEGGGKGSANYWARELWSCRGNKSVSDKPFFGKIKL